MDRWKIAVVLFVSLWLPLQGYGAVAMPFCTHGTTNSGMATTGSDNGRPADAGHQAHTGHGAHAGHEMAPDDHHAAGHHSAAPTTTDQGSNLACNDCGPCHLACSPALFSHLPVFPKLDAAVFDRPTVAALLSFTPERLQRPPLSALA